MDFPRIFSLKSEFFGKMDLIIGAYQLEAEKRCASEGRIAIRQDGTMP